MPHVPGHPPDEQLRAMLERLTFWELDQIISGVSLKLPPGESPVFLRDRTKRENIASAVRWARRASPGGIRLLMEGLQAALRKKEAEERVRKMEVPLPGTRFIRWEELEALPSFPLIRRAIMYPFHHTRTASPKTRDGYVSVAAIYNMSSWASWKSSSLDPQEAAIARAIQRLPLEELMRLNAGRRTDQPAFFPIGFILPREVPRR